MTAQGLEIERESCTLCGDCVETCYAEALEINSLSMTAEAVVDKVERDRVFYDVSGNGGVTLCGGEPLAQPAFALEILALCKQRVIHTTIETCGHYRFAVLEQMLPYLDFIYFDVKHMDPAVHLECTGVSNERILHNLRRLQAYDVEICVRVPVIPTLTDGRQNMMAIAAFVKELPRVGAVELLPYHRLGVNKYRKLGLEYPLDDTLPPEKDEMQSLKTIFDGQGVKCMVRG
jgi:pyruvate formate lyase activating enzyme